VVKGKYDFIQWHKLSLDIRAALLPVIEGARHGACIPVGRNCGKDKHTLSQRKLLEYCLKRFGLFYKKQDEDLYYICDSKAMLEKFWHHPSCIGEFLGYPKCCIAAYDKRVKNVTPENISEKGPAVVFDRKLHQRLHAIQLGESPVDSLYPLLSIFHVPCNINCKKSIALGKKIKKALIKNDPEAAKQLINSNLNRIYYFHFYWPAKSSKQTKKNE
jgi:hypothetical protein